MTTKIHWCNKCDVYWTHEGCAMKRPTLSTCPKCLPHVAFHHWKVIEDQFTAFVMYNNLRKSRSTK
jgi:hypothetical protein